MTLIKSYSAHSHSFGHLNISCERGLDPLSLVVDGLLSKGLHTIG